MLQKQFCMNCGNQVDPAADACHACGTPIPKMPAPGGFSASVSNSVPMQFCANCGNTIGGNLNNCPNCNSPVLNIPIEQTTPITKKKKSRTKKIILITLFTIIFIIIIHVVLLYIGLRTPLNKLEKSIEECDIETYMDIYPQEYLESFAESRFGDMDNLEDNWEDRLDDLCDDMEDELGDNLTLNCTIKGISILDEDEISELNEKYYDRCGVKLDIDKAFKLDVIINFKGDDSYLGFGGDKDIVVMKVDGEWVSTDVTLGVF